MKNLAYLITIVILLSSCFKEEDPRVNTNIDAVSIRLESDYSMQFFYNLASKSIISSNKWTKWDLKFFALDNNYYVKLNDAANMKAFRANSTDFESVSSFDDTWTSYVDDAQGDLSNLALDLEFKSTGTDTLFTNKEVYVLLLGTDAGGNKLAYKKIVIDYFYENYYHIRFANLDGTEEHQALISKDETLNFVYFSFQNEGEVVTIEPDKNNWDLLFTRSTDITITNDFSDTIFDYSVTGVTLNPYNNTAYQINDENYATMGSQDIDETKLTSQLNVIGFNWKSYDLDKSVYAIRQDNYYILKDGNSVFYKMNFLSFVDSETNERGTISFEYDAIK